MVKIVIVSHALVQEVARRRWKILAEEYPYEVHLLVPEYWESTWFGKKVEFNVDEIHEGRFHVHPMPVTDAKNWGRYFFKSIDAKLRKINPELIYVIHEESIWMHLQVSFYRSLWARNAKVVFFSMNGRGVPKKWLHQRLLWWNVSRYTDAALVHYPGCLHSLRSAGYKKPIYMQTQIGVDEELFTPMPEVRVRIRNTLNAGNMFVVGYTGRLTQDKGVDDLVEVFPSLGDHCYLLLVGNGDLKESIEKKASREGWKDRLHITNYLPQEQVPAFMNAMDVFVLGSKTTSHWIDTFPLVTVQAQACGIPVIASDSASLPWQLEDTALIFSEGDRDELKNALLRIMSDTGLSENLARNGKARSNELFCVRGMAANFDRIARQVLKDSTEYHSANEPYTQWKAYR